MKSTFIRALAALVFASAVGFSQQPVSRQYSVSTLPTASTHSGEVGSVKDGLTPLDCATGGGSYVVSCQSTGSAWVAQTVGSAAASMLVIANAASTGTSTSKLSKLVGAPATAVITATSDSGGVIGVVVSGAGTTGLATIQTYGPTSCVFDGATTAGDYSVVSSTVAGDCHDGGNTYPSSGQVLGRVLSTNATSGTYSFYLFPTEVRGFGAGSLTKLFATASLSPSSLVDGACSQIGTITVTGAISGDGAIVGTAGTLPAGLDLFGKTTSANTVTVEACNLSGGALSPPTGSYSAMIIH